LIVVGFFIFGQQFITLWAGADYSESYWVTLIFFTTLICPLIQNLGITILLARGQQKFRSLTYLMIAGLSLMGQLWVTPKYGVIGCAIIIAIAHYIGQWLIMNIYYYKKQRINIPRFWGQIAKMSICPLAIAVTGLISVKFIEFNSWLQLGSAILLFMLIYIPIFYVFSLNKYEKNIIQTPLKLIYSKIKNG